MTLTTNVLILLSRVHTTSNGETMVLKKCIDPVPLGWEYGWYVAAWHRLDHTLRVESWRATRYPRPVSYSWVGPP